MVRRYTLKKCNKKDEGCRYYLCNHHQMESVTKSETIMWNGKKLTLKHTFTAPVGLSVTSESEASNTTSRGLGIDRMYNRNISRVSDITTHHNESEAIAETAKSNAMLVMDSYQLIEQLMAENKRLSQQNDEYKHTIQSIQQTGCVDPKSMNNIENIPTIKSDKLVLTYEEVENNDNEVRRRTGFQSLKH